MRLSRFKIFVVLAALVASCAPQDFGTDLESNPDGSPDVVNDYIGDDSTVNAGVTNKAPAKLVKGCNWMLGPRATTSLTLTSQSGVFATASTEGKIVYALKEFGKGRAIFSGDMNLLGQSDDTCGAWSWLGKTYPYQPRVLVFGSSLCDAASRFANGLYTKPNAETVGRNLPAKYVGNPAALKKDYDVVIYCKTHSPMTSAVGTTLYNYVANAGGGLYLALEYKGFMAATDPEEANTISGPMGVTFNHDRLYPKDIPIDYR